MPKIPYSVSNWVPKEENGGSPPLGKILDANAHDGPEAVTADNKLQQYSGKSGCPKGPFGKKGKMF